MSGDASAAPSPSPAGPTSRRRLLAFLGAGGVAAFAGLFSRNEAQAGHDGTNVLHLGEANHAPAGSLAGSTFLNANPQGPALQVNNFQTGGAEGIIVTARGLAPALNGHAFGSSPVGVHGISHLSPAPEDFGKGSGIGVKGVSGTGAGVEGTSQSGPGVRGVKVSGATGPAVEAISPDIALQVFGKSAFSTAGSAVIAGGEDAHFVPNPVVTGESHISLTLAGDPGPSQVSWIEQDPGSGFTVHLSRPLRKGSDVPLTYLIVEPA